MAEARRPAGGSRLTLVGRSERIRTSGPCLPKTVLYQAELHSDRGAAYSPAAGARQASTAAYSNALAPPGAPGTEVSR
jgi:hypothetical protein